MLRGFPPVVAANTHTMILGSFPGEASLDAAQYYAHPRNQFWRLLGTVLGEHGLHEFAYDARLERVLSHGIGIWDVLAACYREGSLDSAIRHRSRTISRRCASMRRCSSACVSTARRRGGLRR